MTVGRGETTLGLVLREGLEASLLVVLPIQRDDCRGLWAGDGI